MQMPIRFPVHLSVFRQLHRDRRGVSTVEYVIILVLIAVVSITAWQAFGATIMGKIKAADGQITDQVKF